MASIVPPEALPVRQMLLRNESGIYAHRSPGGAFVSNPPEANGAVPALVARPTNTDILYAGSVNGGVWKTINATDPMGPIGNR